MEQALSFEGTGLDLDNNPAAVNPGDSPFRYNVRYGTTERSDLGGIQNTKGSTLLNLNFNGGFFIQPLGDNEVIGSCKDPERDAIIYFVWNSLNQHQIRRIFTKDRKIQVILESPTLNFKRTHKIIHANVVDNTLSWTDGWVDPNNEFNYNPPRQIDIDLAIGNYLGSPWPNGYTTIDFQTLDAIRYAPGLCPSFQYVNNLNFNDNRLYGHLFQFAYRYVYYDNSRSVLSPISKLTLPQGEYIEQGLQTNTQEDYSGNNYVVTVENNLEVQVETGHYTVVRIELIAKEGTSYKVVDYIDKYDDNGTIIVPSDSTYTFIFDNTKFISELTLEEALRTEDALPPIADTQEVISSKQGARRIFGSYVEGYENVKNFKMSASVAIEEFQFNQLDPVTGTLITRKISFKRRGAYSIGVIYADGAGRKSFVQTTASCNVSIPWWSELSLVGQYYDPNNEWILSTNQKPYITWEIDSPPPVWAKTYQIVCTKDINNQETLYGFYNFGLCVGDDKNGQFQRGKNTLYVPPQTGYDFQKGDRIRIVAEFNNLSNVNVTYNSNAFIAPTEVADIRFCRKLGNKPPLQPVNNYQLEVYNTYGDTGTEITFDFPIESFDPATQRIKIQGNLFLDYRTLYRFEIYNPNVEIPEENNRYFEIGETYRIINGQHEKTSGRIDGIDVFVRNQLYKFERVEARIWTNFATKNASDDFVDNFRVPEITFPSGVAGQPASYPTHVLDAAFQRGVIFFQPPPPPNIITGNTSAASGQSRQTTMSLSGAIERKGDITIKSNDSIAGVYGLNGGSFLVAGTINQGTYSDIRLGYGSAVFYNYNVNGQLITGQHPLGLEATLSVLVPSVDFFILDIPIESHAYSDYYESTVDQTGRPYVINREAIRRKYFANLIFGGPVYDNTLINFFSRYDFKDVERLNERYNQITRIQEVGFMLKVRQRNKSTSIYVGRSELTNTDGSTNLAAISDVLGTVNPSDEVWGGTHPGADTKAIRDTYFFDAINGVVVRDATNGLVAISGNKQSANDPYRMTAFFRDLGEFVRQNEENIEVISAWDENTNSYFFTLRVIKDMERPPFVAKYRIEEAWNNGFTLSFHETTNRWQSFHPFIPEWYGQIGNTFVAFRNGEAWMHYTNDIRNSYFGGTHPIITEQICNQYTNNIKVFDNIDVYSNVKWKATDAPSGEDIYIIPNAQFPTGMKSKLSEQNFVGKEGKWHASFLNDMNSPGYSNELLALMNGRKLRGEALRIRLRNEDNDKDVFLRQVIFHFTPSEISG